MGSSAGAAGTSEPDTAAPYRRPTGLATATPERHANGLKAFGGYCWVADTDTVVARIEAMGKSA